jgi:uncharacterized membrane protein YeaQ/YmgE (transglycosylase-associated protein family)
VFVATSLADAASVAMGLAASFPVAAGLGLTRSWRSDRSRHTPFRGVYASQTGGRSVRTARGSALGYIVRAGAKEESIKGEVGQETVGILAWIVVGLVAGVLAKIAMPGPDPGGVILTIVIGIIGAVIGGFVMENLLGGPGVTGVNLASILVATLGSVILLVVYRAITRRAAQ